MGLRPALLPAINFFWNTWLDAHHNILTEEAFSRPGDYVVMEALDNLVCVTTACPDDIDPINGWNPTDIHVRIYTDKTTIPKSVAYRVTEDAPMQKTQLSAFHARLEPLTNHFTPLAIYGQQPLFRRPAASANIGPAVNQPHCRI